MKEKKKNGVLGWILIGISVIFLIVMLILPLIYVLATAFGEGIGVFVAAVTDKYAKRAIALTIEVTVIAVVVNTIFGLVHYKISVSWEKDHFFTDRPATYGITDHCGTCLCADLWTSECVI